MRYGNGSATGHKIRDEDLTEDVAKKRTAGKDARNGAAIGALGYGGVAGTVAATHPEGVKQMARRVGVTRGAIPTYVGGRALRGAAVGALGGAALHGLRRDGVEKGVLRQGVQPRLARRVGAAGRGSRRFVTGDQNSGIIGKGLKVWKPKKPPLPTKPHGQQGLGPGITYKGPGTIGMRGSQSVQKGILSEIGAGLRTAKLSVNAGRAGVPAKGLMHQGSMPKPGSYGAKAVGMGEKAGASITANPGRWMAGSAVGGGLAVNQVKKDLASVAKRRFDPEDERRHRQGLQAGVLGTGGAVASGYGVRGVHRDTKDMRKPVRVPDVEVGRAPGRQDERGFKHKNGKARAATAQEKLGLSMDYDVRAAHWDKQNKLKQELEVLRNRKGTAGINVRGRNALLLGGGLAAMGTAAHQHGRRFESRWD